MIYTHTARKEQRKPGLTHAAQKRDINVFLSQSEEDGGLVAEIIASFQENGSGADNDRPELQKALSLAQENNAELVVSSPDRISRNPEVIVKLFKTGHLCVAAMPRADVSVLCAALAAKEQERKFISLRTKALLHAAKARGVKLGGIRRGSLEKATVARSSYAIARAIKLGSAVCKMREEGMSMAAIAARFNEQSVPTERGGRWDAKAIKRLIDRLSELEANAWEHARTQRAE